MRVLFVLLLCGCLGVAFSESVTMNIVWLNKSSNDPLAVCNDGTPSAYYISLATEPALSNTILFFLQGGGQCYSKETCDSRVVTLMSSKFNTPTIDKTGLFDGEEIKSSLFGATKVFIPYCSSDGWIGDAEPSDITWGYHFRGQRIVRSALNDLIAFNVITSKSSILFGGGSAGARGMMNNVDSLMPLLPAGAKVIGSFLDSPYYIDVVPYNADFAGFQFQTNEIYQRYNVKAIIPDDCAAAYPEESGEGWKCLYGQYRMPFVRSRYLLVASQYDSYQLSYNVGKEPINGQYIGDPKASMYAQSWAAETHSRLMELIQSQQPQQQSFYFSWACYNHDVSETSKYYTLSVEGTSQRDAVDAFMKGGSTTTTQTWIEECNGLFCGTGCEQ